MALSNESIFLPEISSSCIFHLCSFFGITGPFFSLPTLSSTKMCDFIWFWAVLLAFYMRNYGDNPSIFLRCWTCLFPSEYNSMPYLSRFWLLVYKFTFSFQRPNWEKVVFGCKSASGFKDSLVAGISYFSLYPSDWSSLKWRNWFSYALVYACFIPLALVCPSSFTTSFSEAAALSVDSGFCSGFSDMLVILQFRSTDPSPLELRQLTKPWFDLESWSAAFSLDSVSSSIIFWLGKMVRLGYKARGLDWLKSSTSILET